MYQPAPFKSPLSSIHIPPLSLLQDSLETRHQAHIQLITDICTRVILEGFLASLKTSIYPSSRKRHPSVVMVTVSTLVSVLAHLAESSLGSLAAALRLNVSEIFGCTVRSGVGFQDKWLQASRFIVW